MSEPLATTRREPVDAPPLKELLDTLESASKEWQRIESLSRSGQTISTIAWKKSEEQLAAARAAVEARFAALERRLELAIAFQDEEHRLSEKRREEVSRLQSELEAARQRVMETEDINHKLSNTLTAARRDTELLNWHSDPRHGVSYDAVSRNWLAWTDGDYVKAPTLREAIDKARARSPLTPTPEKPAVGPAIPGEPK